MVNFDQVGNLLIHCHDGGSRSVTVAALYIYYKFELGQTTFDEVLSQVYDLRAPYVPNDVSEGMKAAADWVVSQFTEIFPTPVLSSQ